ncbi:hypothetical protein HYX70_00050 [Candidatus Saccharibacteria bacterium]|nr:hypothetical protein [Candidatus Saccharibacteria bacterium]
MITEKQRQDDKEKAILLALQQDMALMRRDLDMYGMRKDGSTVLICKSTDYDELWSDALETLKNQDFSKPKIR